NDVNVVIAQMPVVAQKIVGVRAGSGQRIGLDHHAGDEGGDVIGRAAEHAKGKVGDAAVAKHAPLQVLAGTRAQEIDRVTAAVLLVAHGLVVGGIRLHVVKRGDGCGRVAKGGVTGDVVDALAADIDDAPVAQQLQVLLARAQHRPLLVS